MNKQSVQNQKYRHVKRLFKAINPDKNGVFHIQLTIRRWENQYFDGSEVWVSREDMMYDLTVARHHDKPTCLPIYRLLSPQSFGFLQDLKYQVTTSESLVETTQPLPTGNIENIQMLSPYTVQMRVGIFNTSKYIQHDNLENLQVKVLGKHSHGYFTFQYYSGYDTSPDPPTEYCFGFRMFYKDGDRRHFLTIYSDVDNKLKLGLREGQDDDISTHIDGRCFILAKDNEYLFRSQIYRDKFIQYNRSTDELGLCTIKQSTLSCLLRLRKSEDFEKWRREFVTCRFCLYPKKNPGRAFD